MNTIDKLNAIDKKLIDSQSEYITKCSKEHFGVSYYSLYIRFTNRLNKKLKILPYLTLVMLTTILHAQCCICLQFKMKYIKCKKCKNAVVCRDCLPSLCEGGLCNKCPVCRQTEWKKKVKKNKIIPKRKVNVIINTRYMEEDEESCCDLCTPRICGLCCLKSVRICNLIFLIYVGGLLTIFCFVGDVLDLSQYYWLPIIIGLVEFLLLLVCCFGCCGIKMGLKEILDFSIQKI